ncbi:50S ribosomal protein L17 [Candidatus Shikimatogenerans bostrichidophilus]|uniref:50S ribosomal protein L17 n=1 Tax=Candidatus Shikimatogenerans bostrichidophilus TaxID=2943807 RepID=UPI002966E336
MRHIKNKKNLSRKYSHRKSLLSNLSCNLIIYKSIYTTLCKAKELQKYIEPIINKLKKNNIHTKRIILKKLKNKKVVKILFNEILKKTINRKGGYTRILKFGYRKGDASIMSIIQLVDYYKINE